jgi:hypothetical protein
LTISKKVDQPAPPEIAIQDAIEIRFAESNEDCWAVYQFLIRAAGPSLLGEVNQLKAVAEVLRVANEGASIMAILNGKIVGTLGLISVDWWYSDSKFLTNRWFFVEDDLKFKGVGARLLAEAHIIGKSADLPVVIIGHKRMRNNGIHFTRVQTFAPDQPSETKH